MSTYSYVLITVVILLVNLPIQIAVAYSYKDKEKVDVGFCYNYYALSYRRKMIRDLINSVFIILLIIYINRNGLWDSPSLNILIIFAFSSQLIQLLYNYIFWKKTEKRNEVSLK